MNKANNLNLSPYFIATAIFIADLIFMSLSGRPFTYMTREAYYLDCFDQISIPRRIFFLLLVITQSLIFGFRLFYDFILIIIINLLGLVFAKFINHSYLSGYLIASGLMLITGIFLKLPWTILSVTVNLILIYFVIKYLKAT